jgi:hypothetical protein
MSNSTPEFDTTRLAKDFSPTGIKYVGQYENDRNAVHSAMYKAMIKEAYGVSDCIIGHHMVYMREEKDAKGFEIQIVEEIPSADALLFDHCIMQKLFGDSFREVIAKLAQEPAETRDEICALHYYNRGK